ncbi:MULTISPECIES: cation:proton antiporter [Acidithrix]|uniref:K(+)/H(+) antiporter NhaP n=1 Tax=Acidithrix ferrooxidans TaxID=1280514 RepID=A0A0D8HM06_9ACTN|nr:MULTISPECIES: cation:proton antiporter [Acidithrix]KJF18797.1 K(+)/H(+) antiporter NhaP [Acidithrix ferrooxidans]CAG4912742.1 unnamed protein product [Acidithrix sp. C25]
MSDTVPFAITILIVSIVGLLAVVSSRLSSLIKIPSPAFFFVGASLVATFAPHFVYLSPRLISKVVTVALVIILFEGGMHIGWSKVKAALIPILGVGIIGTFLTTIASAVFIHYSFGLSWYAASLIATAIAPTDPAMVFSVLGQREISGISGDLIEGESGANDPVGISLMVALIGAGGVGASSLLSVGGNFILQMAVGALLGIVGGRLLLVFMRSIPLPKEGLYPLRSLTFIFIIYAAATIAHGSGFLAVFLGGIIIGDERAPYKGEIVRFHSALASLGEIVAFFFLGMMVDLHQLMASDIWLPGLIIALVLIFLVRPLFVGPILATSSLSFKQSIFVLFAGLKGAVPVLLGSYLLSSHIPGASRLFGIIVIVVLVSVVVQGSFVPMVARLLYVPMRIVEPEPWSIGVSLANEPDGVHRLVVAKDSLGDGSSISEVMNFPGGAWISMVVRDGGLIPVNGATILLAGDSLLILGDSYLYDALVETFERHKE